MVDTMSKAELAERVAKADHALQAGDWNQAREWYEWALAQDPNLTAAQRGLERLNRLEDVNGNVQEMIAKADEYLSAGKYRPALEAYTQALDRAGSSGILKYHARLEEKLNEVGELAAWQERVQNAVQVARQKRKEGDLKAAQQMLDALLKEQADDDRFTAIASEARLEREQVLKDADDEYCFRSMREAFQTDDFELVITLGKSISPSFSRYDEMLRNVKRAQMILENTILPKVQEAEIALQEGRWADAFALLNEGPRKQFPQNPNWRRLWLKVGMTHAQQELAEGRQANMDRDFQKAQAYFEQAHQVLIKVGEVYRQHDLAISLRQEAEDLAKIAGFEQLAQGDWQAGRRSQAQAALEQARLLVDQAGISGRDYKTVGAVVAVMLETLKEELKRIQRDELQLQDGQRLFEEKRLDEARRCFQETQTALTEEHHRMAVQKLRAVEDELTKFGDEMQRGRTAGTPEAAVEAYQAAYDRYPHNSEALQSLENVLVSAGQAALKAGRAVDGVRYAERALILNPHNRDAQALKTAPDLNDQLQGIWQQGQVEWERLNRQSSLNVDTYKKLADRLDEAAQNARDNINSHGFIKPLQDLAEAAADRAARLQRFAELKQRADAARLDLDWDGAVRLLEQAREALGDALSEQVTQQQQAWEAARQKMQAVRQMGGVELNQAQDAYRQARQSNEFGEVLDLLRRVDEGLRQASDAALAAEGGLPPEIEALGPQVTDLRKRAEAAQAAAASASARDGLLRVREAIRILNRDETLGVLEARLSEMVSAEIPELLERAEMELKAGGLNRAEDLLKQVYELQPRDPRVAERYASVQRRRKVTEKLQNAEDRAEACLTDNSPGEALKAYKSGLLTLLEPEAELPIEAREVLRQLLNFGEIKEGLALGFREFWPQALLLLGQLEEMGFEHWAVASAAGLARTWADLARDQGLWGISISGKQLQDYLLAYQASYDFYLRHTEDDKAEKQLIANRNEVVTRIKESLGKRLDWARASLDHCEWQEALKRLEEGVGDFYTRVKENAPEILDETGQVRDLELQIRQLRSEAEQQQVVLQSVQPELDAARQALLDSDQLDGVESRLLQVKAQQDLGKKSPAVERKVNELLEQVALARLRKRQKILRDALAAADVGLKAVLDAEGAKKVLQQLEGIAGEVDLQSLPIENREQYSKALLQAQELEKSWRSGDEWLKQAEEARQEGDYEKAIQSYEEVLKVIGKGEREPTLRLHLAEMQRKQGQQRRQEETLRRGVELLNQGQYKDAQVELRKARDLNLDVSALLAAADIGMLMEKAEKYLEAGLHEEARLELSLAWEIQQEQNTALKSNPTAREIVQAARRLEQRIGMRYGRQAALQEGLLEMTLFLTTGRLDAAQEGLKKLKVSYSDNSEVLVLEQRLLQAQQILHLLREAHQARGQGRLREAREKAQSVLKLHPEHPDALTLIAQVDAVLKNGLAEVEVYLALNQIDEAQAKVQALKEQFPSAEELAGLPQAIARRRQAGQKLKDARAARDRGDYDEARDLVQSILVSILPDDPEAVELLHQIDAGREANQALRQAQHLIDTDRFQEARSALQDSVSKGARQDETRKVQAQLDEQESVWRSDLESSLRQAVRAEDYVQALSVCQSALTRILAPDFRQYLERRQAEIISQKVNRILDDLHQRMRQQLDEDGLREISAQLEQLKNSDPPPGQPLLRGIKDLQKRADTNRLKQKLDAVRLQVEANEWDAALEQLRALDEEANSLNLGEVQALVGNLEWEIQDRKMALEDTRDRQQRDELMNKAKMLWAKVGGREDLQTVVGLASRVLQMPKFVNDRDAQELQAHANEALQLLESSETAVTRSRELICKRDFKGAAGALSLPAVSPFIKDRYEHQRQVVRLLLAAEQHQDNKAWELAWKAYRDVLQAESSLETLLDGDMERCLQRLMDQRIEQVQAALSNIPPQTELARAWLDEMAANGWIIPLYQTGIKRVNDWLISIERSQQAREVLQAEAGDPVEALHLLEEARRHLPADQSDAEMRQWIQAAQAVRDREEHLLIALQPPASELPRVRHLIQELEAGRRKREAEERAQKEAERKERFKQALEQVDNSLEAFDLAGADATLADSESSHLAVTEAEQSLLAERRKHVAQLRQDVALANECIENVHGCLAHGQLDTAVDALLPAITRIPAYRLVVEKRIDLQDRIKVLATDFLMAGQFEQSQRVIDLGIDRLGTREDLAQLRNEIAGRRQRHLEGIRMQVAQALEAWDLDLARDVFVQGQQISQDDRELSALHARLGQMDVVAARLEAPMKKGWDALRSARYADAYQAFLDVLQLTTEFRPAQAWRDYALAMNIGTGTVESKNYAQAVQMFTQAERGLRLRASTRMPSVLGSQAEWLSRHRQAVFEAWRLGNEARELLALYSQIDGLMQQGTPDALSKARRLLQSLRQKHETFSRMCTSPAVSPEDFDLSIGAQKTPVNVSNEKSEAASSPKSHPSTSSIGAPAATSETFRPSSAGTVPASSDTGTGSDGYQPAADDPIQPGEPMAGSNYQPVELGPWDIGAPPSFHPNSESAPRPEPAASDPTDDPFDDIPIPVVPFEEFSSPEYDDKEEN